jgi:hypothetical protein
MRILRLTAQDDNGYGRLRVVSAGRSIVLSGRSRVIDVSGRAAGATAPESADFE